MTKPEILAPAGDFQRLKIAIAYGADAVYIGGAKFSLRQNAKNFEDAELEAAVRYAREHKARLYAGVNIFAHNDDFDGMEEYLRRLKKIGVDAVIVSDLGVFDIARSITGLEIHISTQASVTNHRSAMFYRDLGASRIILARELSLNEIKEITQKCAADNFKTEVFVHGAMCVSYSGRCLISNYLTGRDANRGDCAQPCRSKYFLTEERRPREAMPIEEDGRGTYLFDSKDLCMVEYIPELLDSGAASFKIEGRMRTPYYVANAARVYREALDDYFESPELYESKKAYYLKELYKTAGRNFCTGFYFGRPADAQNLAHGSQGAAQDFLGLVGSYNADKGLALIEGRNKFSVGDSVEFLMAGFSQEITEMFDEDGAPINSAPHPKQRVYVRVSEPVTELDIMRKFVL